MVLNLKNRSFNLWIIAGIICVITLAHYTMPHRVVYLHDISRRLYYLPIILAAYWYGRQGGIYSALAVTMVYFPHALFSWYGRNPRYLDNMIEIGFFNVVGYLIGTYIERKNEQRLQAERTALELKQAYARLESGTEKLMELEEKLRFSDRLSILGELSASLAHEVRNPLGGIQGAAEIFRQKFSPDDPAQEFVEIQLREIQRLNDVIHNYLSLSSKEAKNFEQVNIGEVVKNTLSLLRISARTQKVEMQANCRSAGPALVAGNTLQLQQALLNLALNAIHAMDSGGRLTINCGIDHNSDQVRIEVIDNGSGIAPDQQERIFETFYTTRPDGTGLGLPIVKRIIDQHGGKIEFTSSGQGTTFVIFLPLHPDHIMKKK